MSIERVSECIPEEEGLYVYDEKSGIIYVSVLFLDLDSKKKSYGFIEAEKFFPTTPILESEVFRLNSYQNRGYKIIGEVESDKTIRESLQVLLSSNIISEVVILKREAPNKYLILGKIGTGNIGEKIITGIKDNVMNLFGKNEKN